MTIKTSGERIAITTRMLVDINSHGKRRQLREAATRNLAGLATVIAKPTVS
jgi:hypothetical protein